MITRVGMILLLISVNSIYLFAKDSLQITKLQIIKIVIEGNTKTKNSIILRELELYKDSLYSFDDLQTRILLSQNNLLRTQLFNSVDIRFLITQPEESNAELIVSLKENWYLYPAPIIEVGDRNWNVWWNEQGRKLNRLNYGIKVTHHNLSGRKDVIRLKLQHGYTQKYELQYIRPYIDFKKTLGFQCIINYQQNKEVAYNTDHNKPVYYKSSEVLLEQLRLGLGITFRKHIQWSHRGTIQYFWNGIHNSVIEINPNFFGKNGLTLQYGEIELSSEYSNQNHQIIPTTGIKARLLFNKSGIIKSDDKQQGFVQCKANYAVPVRRHLSLHMELMIMKGFTSGKPVVFNYEGLGYGDEFIRGYEYYVLNGLDLYVSRNNMRYLIWDKSFYFFKILKNEPIFNLNYKWYLSAHLDAGYVKDPYYASNNALSNIYLQSGGVGLDVLMMDRYLVQIQYSINHLREGGLFIHANVNF